MKKINLVGSKSITNRDLILASLAKGKSNIRGILESDDTMYMIEALKKLGVKITKTGNDVLIESDANFDVGEDIEIFVGQSGTSIRFLTALLALNKSGSVKIYGDSRLNQRPIGEILKAFDYLGVNYESKNGYPPIKVYPSKIKSSKIVMDGSISSQFFTAFLIISGALENGLEINVENTLVSKPYIDLTIEELRKFGIFVENIDYKKFIIKKQKYKNVDLWVEADASALSYFANYIVLHSGELEILNIGSNTKQGDYKYLEVLKIFGLDYSSDGKTTILKSNGLKKADLTKYKNFSIDFEDMPDVSMSFMTLAIFLPGVTTITGLQTLNLKESKRLDVMKKELEKLGVDVEIVDSSIKIGEFNQKLSGKIQIETYNDHRIAMVFGVLNTYIGNLEILNPSCVSKTYPNFWEDLENLGK